MPASHLLPGFSARVVRSDGGGKEKERVGGTDEYLFEEPKSSGMLVYSVIPDVFHDQPWIILFRSCFDLSSKSYFNGIISD